MSKEILEIKKKISEAQKRTQEELKQKHKEKFSKLINSAANKQAKLEEEIKIREENEKNKLYVFFFIKTAIILTLSVGLIYSVVYLNSKPVYELSKLKKKDFQYEEIKTIKSISTDIYNAFQTKNYTNIQKLANRIDNEWQNECIEIISNLSRTPDFEKMQILSPFNRENLFYAFIPVSKELKLQFVFRKENNLFFFEGLYVN